jgi:hypothetical protein
MLKNASRWELTESSWCRPTGLVRVDFYDGEEFRWNPLVTTIQHIIVGTHYIDHFGTLHVQTSITSLSTKVRFKEPFIAFSDKQVHQVWCSPAILWRRFQVDNIRSATQ